MLVLVIAVLPWLGQAHVGSPDVFHDGEVGPYPVRITIRMPTVVPGRAEISVRVQGTQPEKVFFSPLFARTSITNAPPPDLGVLIEGETNLYSGELWLMSVGAYTIEIKLSGPLGTGKVQIPVSSVPLSQLPMPRFLGIILVGLGVILFFGGVAIVAAAARESVLAPGGVIGKIERRKGRLAAGITTVILLLGLVGGRRWWNADEAKFRTQLRGGAWPDLKAAVRVEGTQRILRLTLGEVAFGSAYSVPLIPDHGKLLHLFLIREGTQDGFAHLHPVRKGGNIFDVALPALPPGRYKVLCDLTMEGSVLSSTATNSVEVPTLATQATLAEVMKPDPDDSWAVYAGIPVPKNSGVAAVYRLLDGSQVEWKATAPIRVRQDAGLNFEVRDASGQPVDLSPYMGMLSHAAILRSDGGVFSHLHPTGNYSMAAQAFFDKKLQRETRTVDGALAPMVDHSKMDHSGGHAKHKSGISSISLPYEFPTAGDYRIWVQFKVGDQVQTAVFDTTVAD